MKNNFVSSIKTVRPQTLASNIVIVDGFSGSGKSLILPLLSHLENGEVWQISEESEQLCYLECLNKIDRESAKTLLKIHFDKKIYNLNISRNVNFRASDDSSVQNTLLTNKYKKRMEDKTERFPIVDRIKKTNPLLVMDAHYVFGVSDLYLKSFSDNLKAYIFMLRSPSHLVSAYFMQDISRLIEDEMSIELCVEIDGYILPHYVSDYYKEYIEASNDLEKCILIVCKYYEKVFKMYESLSIEDKEKFYFICFENFIVNPDFFIDIISNKVNIKKSKTYKKIFKHLNMPRDKVEVDRTEVDKLSEEKNIRIGEKYTSMLNDTIKWYKDFLTK